MEHVKLFHKLDAMHMFLEEIEEMYKKIELSPIEMSRIESPKQIKENYGKGGFSNLYPIIYINLIYHTEAFFYFGCSLLDNIARELTENLKPKQRIHFNEWIDNISQNDEFIKKLKKMKEDWIKFFIRYRNLICHEHYLYEMGWQHIGYDWELKATPPLKVTIFIPKNPFNYVSNLDISKKKEQDKIDLISYLKKSYENFDNLFELAKKNDKKYILKDIKENKNLK